MTAPACTPATVLAELEVLGAAYGLEGARLTALAEAVRPWLPGYAELVLAERGCELITGGEGSGCAEALAGIAREAGVSEAACAGFLACQATFPGRKLGLKLPLGPDAAAPTLYCRTLAPTAEALRFLAGIGLARPALAALERALGETRTVYGLGFGPALKTYALADLPAALFAAELHRPLRTATVPGFVSHRLDEREARPETKVYLPDVGWEELRARGPRWERILRIAADRLRWRAAGHIGLTLRPDARPELKLYVERIGAIPTDLTRR